MSNSSMTRLANACLASMNDEEYHEWNRQFLLLKLKGMMDRDEILEYRYRLITMDAMETKNVSEVLNLFDEIIFGEWEKKRSILLERLGKGGLMIVNETDEARKEKLIQHYKKLEGEYEEWERKCPRNTKY